MINNKKLYQLIKVYKWSVCAALSFSPLSSYGQDASNFNFTEPVINVIPPSPNVVEFQQYVDVPINHYTGIPEINIPLYTLKTPQLTLPISLTYHAGGLKVGSHASWVGAGWTLNAGGVIGRTVRGKAADETIKSNERNENAPFIYGLLTHDYTEENTRARSPVSIYDLKRNISNPAAILTRDDSLLNIIDFHPDIFTYSSSTGSGKFYLTKNLSRGSSIDVVKDIGDDNNIVSPFRRGSNGYVEDQEGWLITTPDGSELNFNVRDSTEDTSFMGFEFRGESSITANSYNRSKQVSAWHLKNMKNGGDSISFTYDKEIYQFDNPTRLSVSYAAKAYSYHADRVNDYFKNFDSKVRKTFYFSNATHQTHRISTITASNGISVEFFSDHSRKDLLGAKALTELRVYQHDKFVIGYIFEYNYFGNKNDPDQCKLILKRVFQIDEHSNEINDGYQFDYYGDSDQMFNRLTPYYDWWGYPNRMNSERNNPFLPPLKVEGLYLSDRFFDNHPREPNFNVTLHAALKEVIYPSKGSANFIYESHEQHLANNLENVILRTSATSVDGTITSDFEDFTLKEDTYVTFSAFSNLGICEENDNPALLPADSNCPYNETDGTRILVYNESDFGFTEYNLKKEAYPLIPLNREEYLNYYSSSCLENNLECDNNLEGLQVNEYTVPQNCSYDVSEVLDLYSPNRYLLPAGKYRLFSSSSNSSNYSGRIEYERFDAFNSLVGGLRIKNILMKDQNKEVVKFNNFSYTSKYNEQKSSGKVFQRPFFGFRYKFNETLKKDILDGLNQLGTNDPRFPVYGTYLGDMSIGLAILSIEMSEETSNPILTNKGSVIGYSKVTQKGVIVDSTRSFPEDESIDIFSNYNGYTTYEFVNDVDFDEQSKDYAMPYPNLIKQDLSYKNGKILEKNIFNDNSQILKRIQNKYSYNYQNDLNVQGITLYTNINSQVYTGFGSVKESASHPVLSYYRVKPYIYFPYTFTSRSSHLISSIVSDFSYSINDEPEVHQQQTLYTYGRFHTLPLTISTFEPEFGKGHLTTYTRSLPSPALHTERKVYKINNISGTQPISDPTPAIAGERISYKGRLPKSYEKLIWKKPIGDEREIPGAAPREYVQSYVRVMEVDYSEDNEQLVVRQLVADDQGAGASVLQQKIYIWDALHQPLAEVVNAERSEVYYNGFEEIEDANAKVGRGTGNLVMGLYAIPANELPEGDNLVVSFYWLDSSGEWQYQRQPYNGEATVGRSDAQAIDELRIHPADAQMTTYAHRPGWGITYSCDANSLATHYYYDSFGRLEEVRDHQGNLVQQTDYHYLQTQN